MSTAKRKGASRLGRGLDALLSPATPTVENEKDSPKENTKITATDNELLTLPIAKLTPGKYQPRREMSDAGLEK